MTVGQVADERYKEQKWYVQVFVPLALRTFLVIDTSACCCSCHARYEARII